MRYRTELSRIGLLALSFAFPALLSAQGTWTYYTSSNSTLLSDSIRSIAVDSSGVVRVSSASLTGEAGGVFTEAGVNSFDGNTWTRELDEDMLVEALVTAPNGRIYGVVMPGGEPSRLWWREGEVWEPIPTGRESTNISTTVISSSGRLFGWTEGYPSPWFYVSEPDANGEVDGQEFELIIPQVSQQSTYSLTTLGVGLRDTLWGVIDEYELTAGGVQRKETPTYVMRVAYDDPAAGWKAMRFESDIFSIASGWSSRAAFATSTGVLIHEGGTLDKNWSQLPGILAASRVVQDRKGDFWIVGTTSQSDPRPKLIHYTIEPSLITILTNLPFDPSTITDMEVDRNGAVWIGTDGNGVAVWRSGATSVPLSAANTVRVVATATPNPASDRVELRLSLPARTAVVVEVFDGVGRVVDEIYRGVEEDGESRYVWNGEAPAGAYYFRVTTRFGTTAAPFVRTGG